MTLPTAGAAQGDILFNVGDAYVENSWTVINDTIPYAVVDKNKSINFGFNASGSGSDDWCYRNLYTNFKAYDNSAPVQRGIAPMAFGKYSVGDTVFITVTFNEVIAAASDVVLGEIEGMSLTDVEYFSGIGTNTIVFQATVAEDFEVTPEYNNTLVNTKPLTGTFEDFLGNK